MNTEAPVGTGIPTGDPRTGSHGVTAADVERWLAELGLEPVARAEREGVASWDIELDGRRRLDLSITLILDPAVALVCWLHFAPPIGDGFRRSYRRLLRWNDEFPFLKFSVAEDERPILAAELPVGAGTIDAEVLGLALARMVAVSDRLLEESADWLWIGGRMPAGYRQRERRNQVFLDRFADRVAEYYR
jgi:hypothetical protein